VILMHRVHGPTALVSLFQSSLSVCQFFNCGLSFDFCQDLGESGGDIVVVSHLPSFPSLFALSDSARVAFRGGWWISRVLLLVEWPMKSLVLGSNLNVSYNT